MHVQLEVHFLFCINVHYVSHGYLAATWVTISEKDLKN